MTTTTTKEEDISGSRRRPKAGSVWESRMKTDEVRGGIKVFNGDIDKQSPVGKRKTWKSHTFRSEFTNDSDLSSTSAHGIHLKSHFTCGESRSDEDKPVTTQNNNPNLDLDEEDDDFVKIDNLDIKQISVEDQKPNKSDKKSLPTPPPPQNHAKFNPIPHNFPRSNSKLQSFVDLVMWRDVSKSAFVFGIGTFAIISSSYTKDLNISFISLLSYLALVYLAAIFLFTSLISRGSRERNSTKEDYVAGEEEAIWVVKLFLPYVNEFLVKLRALFSGDPATTMKLALLLFILARCGNSITIWKMAKLGFIGVFTVPKVWSTYSSLLTAHGKFWIRRFGDAWKSCNHKKAVGFAIFTLIWNFSSVVARIWAVFMLFVAFKYYQQQSLIKEGWVEEVGINTENSTPQTQSIGVGRRFIQIDMRKQKKAH